MPVQGLRSVAANRNGVGAFVLQCRRIDITYCDRWASSQGMNSFLRHDLKAFAEQNPQIEIRVSPRPHNHPVVKGHYINGRDKSICVRNMEKNQILQKLNLIKEASGEKLRRVKKPVTSMNESVRGIWSPYHGDVKSV